MMALLLALISGIGSLVNLAFFGEIVWLQGILTFLAWLGLFSYQGKKTVKSYNGDGTRLFTIRFGICILALLGSTLILAIKLLGWE